jgi:hypothetical protein
MTDEMMRLLVDLANDNNVLMDGTTGPVKRVIDSADIVFAVWPKKRGGVSGLILKGERTLREIVASGRPMTQSITAIQCVDLEQALAAKQVFGLCELDS